MQRFLLTSRRRLASPILLSSPYHHHHHHHHHHQHHLHTGNRNKNIEEMPPKKSAPRGKGGKQSTLGTFFTLPKGMKPPPPPPPTTTKREKLVVSEGESDHDLVMAGTEELAKEKKKKESPEKTSTKKRARDSEEPEVEVEEQKKKEAEEEEEDEEPVTKRGRKSSATAKAKAAAVDSSKSSEPKKKATETKASEADETKTAAAAVKSPTPKKEKAEGAAAPAKPKKAAATAAKGKAKKTTEKALEEESGAASESEDAASELDAASDTEKPAITQKARKEVQAKLTSKGKGEHPYPDWPAGSPVPYAALIKTFTLIDGTSKRLQKQSYTSLFLQQVLRLTPDELVLVVHLMINKMAADYEGLELGIGESLLMKAICESYGRSMSGLKQEHREIGDLGEVAMRSRSTQSTLFKPKPLTAASVHAGLKEIATTKGEGGQGRKLSHIQNLLHAAKGDEAKYLVRGMEGKLRLGLAEKTVIVGLSQAVVVHQAAQEGKGVPSLGQMTAAEAILKEVYSELPNYEIIIPAMMKNGIMNLKDTCKLQPGVPLKPMLARPTKAISEVLDRFEGKRFTCEYKYDGERVQIHYVAPKSSLKFPTIDPEKGIAKIFSRNSEDLSVKYPDILAALPNWVQDGVESFVLDCEAVAWDSEQKRVLPFQQLMTRKRKDVAIEDIKVKVCVFGFDLLFLNGKPLLQETLQSRRELMHNVFTPILGEFLFATHTDGQEVETIQQFLEESIKASCEGLMVKMLDTPESYYEPSKRSRNWLKIKKDYLASVADSLDLVVIGAYHGKGKRTSVYGAFLLACYNPSTQNYETICNIGTGFSDEILRKLHTQLVEFEIEKPKPYYMHATGNMQQPDVWFEPRVVWEVKTADLSLSPTYMAAKGLPGTEGKGVSLRFPRFIRERDDKKPDDATWAAQVAEMYLRQDVVQNAAKKSGGTGGVDDDFEY